MTSTPTTWGWHWGSPTTASRERDCFKGNGTSCDCQRTGYCPGGTAAMNKFKEQLHGTVPTKQAHPTLTGPALLLPAVQQKLTFLTRFDILTGCLRPAPNHFYLTADGDRVARAPQLQLALSSPSGTLNWFRLTPHQATRAISRGLQPPSQPEQLFCSSLKEVRLAAGTGRVALT